MKIQHSHFFIFSILMICSLTFPVSAESFKISNVNYKVEGATKIQALESNFKIDREKVFASEEDLNAYISNLQLLFNNERNFQKVEIECVKTDDNILSDESNELQSEKIIPVTLDISITDSKHFLLLPGPKYSTSDGFSLKLKAKDTNFLGTLNEMTADLFYVKEAADEDSSVADSKVGFDFTYNFPFKAGIADAEWINDYNLSWTFNKPVPEYSALTGLSFTVPVNSFSVKAEVYQTAVNNFDYSDYGDALYFGNEAKLSVPVEVYESEKTGVLKVTPFADFTVNYDADGINEENTDLSGPVAKAGLSFTAGQVNWAGNFRNGFSFKTDLYAGWNFQLSDFSPRADAELAAFKNFNHFAMEMRLYGFTQKNGSELIGPLLRGINDKQKFASGPVTEKCTKVNSAVVLNMDFPVRIISWNWHYITDSDFMQKFNFEVQASPFLDAALTTNKATGRNFSYKDGFYSGGFEVLVFPEHWRSIVVRGSLGFDLGRIASEKLNWNFIDTSWRKTSVKPYEISVGMGLLY